MENSCCTESQVELEAILSFDDRGQLVLPKEIRSKFNLEAGEKFALVSCKEDGDLCCFTLIKTNRFGGAIKSFLKPVFNAV